MAIVIGPCWTNFCSQQLKSRILATFGFERMALRATQPKLHSMFCSLFLKIVLSAVGLLFVGCRQRQVLRRQARYNWHFKGQYSWSHWWNTAEHNAWPAEALWNYFPLLTERIVLSNKKKNLRKYSVVFFKAFSKKKVIWLTLYYVRITLLKCKFQIYLVVPEGTNERKIEAIQTF